MAKESNNPHQNHRSRLKQRYLAEGADNFPDHILLELLLFYSIPRMDTNGIAHELLNEFGSFSGVLNADHEDLIKIPGIGKESALLLRLITDCVRRYLQQGSGNVLSVTSTEDAVNLLRPYFLGKNRELFVTVFLDGCSNVIKTVVMEEGETDSVKFNVNKIIRMAENCHAMNVVLAHSHPTGFAVPSVEDIFTTETVIDKLKICHVGVCDHLIFSQHDCYSFAQKINRTVLKERLGFSVIE